MSWKEQLENRFGAHRVHRLANPLHPEQQLVQLYLELNVPVTVVCTSNLSEYHMPVSEKWKGREFTEICFVLPAYWDLEDIENPNFNWIYHWLFKLETFVREKQTWFGPGHTIPCGNPPAPISETMQQDHFIFTDPMFLANELEPVNDGEKTVHFLTIVPIFSDELDYKMGKGTMKFVRKLQQRNHDERLDEYRKSIQRSRFRFF